MPLNSVAQILLIFHIAELRAMVVLQVLVSVLEVAHLPPFVERTQPSAVQTEQVTAVLEEELEWLTHSRSGVLGLLLEPQPRQIALRNDLTLPFRFP